ncbi:lipoprotein [Verminephrobacter eiseniae]|uniref:lipoprotein n=1 Tax=Verminephrobacter eiseniae TaxID=364317 RepID=UPI0002E7FD88|nr:lipoprotein [Verminephrobacter eiseniae]
MSKTSTRTTMAARAASALLLATLAGASAALLIGCGQRGPLYLPARQQTTPPSAAPTTPAAPAIPASAASTPR